MSDTVPFILALVGLALFVVGDMMWLLRNTFNRPMNLRMTGGLVGGGIALISTGLGWWAIAGG